MKGLTVTSFSRRLSTRRSSRLREGKEGDNDNMFDVSLPLADSGGNPIENDNTAWQSYK